MNDMYKHETRFRKVVSNHPQIKLEGKTKAEIYKKNCGEIYVKNVQRYK